MSIPNRGPELLGVNIAFVATAVLAYMLRVFVRVKMVKAFGFDDWLMGMAMLFMLFYVISSNIGIQYGTGRHHRDLSKKDIERARHCWWFCYIFYSWAMIFAKLSIGYLLLRISIKRIHTWILYLAMLTSIVAGGAFFFVVVFQCWPVYRFWVDHDLAVCVSNDLIVGLAYTYSTFSIISDFTFAIIPGFLVWDLQLKRRAKVALVPLITMGCIASAAVIARLPFVRFFNSPDFLWATTDIAIWSTVEQGLAITAGSLATLRPLFFLAMHRLGLSTQRPSYGGKSNPINAMGGASSNQKQDSLRPDVYKLSTVVETRKSNDSGHKNNDKYWYDGALPQVPPKESKKLSKKHQSDNESQRSLKMKSSSASSDDEDPMQIMVSKSFYITDEERSLASRETPYR
ncbi:hypothetical protein SNOG_00122 [Parastagonospora nodorum SN15]|uniref:Rhodopsin domain-containing protein n=2 Tax=Phaeosphaeria nodorum (strain SN15 / ATCC MYA-4574 / FGSC 10173) TaxID=321614 RepID=A0A7U2HSX3_PHANO|nr:hypothetical protein SNOG_00122 [Parastagonospora nodorum SN15]EAT91617.2 hypothetical protein SNOG_00122 [Parastagonospora nodorum SN15]QRC90600.1 hypothetical protein JI435_001220 [Parastagonospora nodorum SN15]